MVQCNIYIYISEVRADLSFSTKALLRQGAGPKQSDKLNTTRAVRYSKGVPECCLNFSWKQDVGAEICVYVDSDWSGETDTRRSTSGGAALAAGTCLKHWCSSQTSVSLSSGEAEIKAAVKGSVEGLYIVHLLEEQSYSMKLRLFTDSQAAFGNGHSLGPGKRMRQLHGMELWLQQLVRNNRLSIEWVHGVQNPAELFARYLNREGIMRHMIKLGYKLFNEKGDEITTKDLMQSMTESVSNKEDDDWEVRLLAFVMKKQNENKESEMVALILDERKQADLSQHGDKGTAIWRYNALPGGPVQHRLKRIE